MSKRIHVAQVLLEAGFELQWVNANSKHVSNHYANHVRDAYPAKDELNIAIYYEEDRVGLVSVAAQVRSRDLVGAMHSNESQCPHCFLTHAGECF